MTGLKKALRSRRGFTLVELIVVLVIMGVLGTVTVPALTGYVDSSKEKQAVSETQACVETATRLAAQQYAKAQELSVKDSIKGTPSLDNLNGWIDKSKSTSAPTVTGDLALTEGTGQYFLNVQNPQQGNLTATSGTKVYNSILSGAGVSGTIKTVTFNTNGQLLYLVYTSKDGITVVYTNSGSTTTVKTDDALKVVPTPEPTTAPNPNPPIDTPDSLIITLNKRDADTNKPLADADFTLTCNGTVVQTLTTTTNSTSITISKTGTYVLTETEAPDGYTIAAPVQFEVTLNGNGKKLEISCTDARYQASGKKFNITDEPIKQLYHIVAVDEEGKPISGVPLYITGANLGKRDTSDTEWNSSAATSGHSIELRAGTYSVHVTESSTEYESPCWFEFTVNDDFSLTDGNTSDGDKGWVNNPTKTIYLQCKKKGSGGELILTGSDVTVTISGIKPWPAKDTPLHPGEIYYVEKDGERIYYMITCMGNDATAQDSPENTSYAAKLAKDKITHVWTDSTIQGDNDAQGRFTKISNGDLYIHNGVLYLYKNGGGEWSQVLPPWSDTSGSWVTIGNPYSVDIERKYATVEIRFIDKDSQTPVPGQYLKLENLTGTLLRTWGSTTEAQIFDLSVGTYKVSNKNTYPVDGYKDFSPLSFSVLDSDNENTVIVNVEGEMQKYNVTVHAQKQIATGTSPMPDAKIQVEGICASGQTYKATVTTDKNGDATFTDLPCSKNGYSYTFTALAKGTLTPSDSISQTINQYNQNGNNLNFTYKP